MELSECNYSEGDRVVVIDCKACHNFSIGEHVIITETGVYVFGAMYMYAKSEATGERFLVLSSDVKSHDDDNEMKL